ncbi:MAG: tRNA dihydrouridine synthase DusB [Acidimicrobiales bacterium mtb01]|nr:tRNA dihydrouridine synthase DusB [Actinomycetota bacterium]TEX47430.1 MAG: tRNA dihydrouridine synthase DusB [Acidimicrobiales bacterium mtb01]
MAGVTNAPFRALCRRFAPGLLYVNEMVMATALVLGNAKTERMVAFGPDESPRSLQLYGSDPKMIGAAVDRLASTGGVDHIDMNFGCPAQKVTRKGGGAAVPAKPNLLRAIMRAAVSAASPYGIPVTAKFRMGIDDSLITFLDTGRIAEDEGIAAVALHARTAEQHYAGEARWEAIARLKSSVSSIPVLGNGDIWAADDALRMMHETGCDGVVIGRGCLGRPWLFGDLVAALGGAMVPDARTLGFVAAIMAEHVRLLSAHFPTDDVGIDRGVRDFRKHVSWYLTGYPVGGEIRARLATASSVGEVDDLLGEMLVANGSDLAVVPGGERIRRGKTNGPIRVALPDGYLEHLDDMCVPDDNDVMALSGG